MEKVGLWDMMDQAIADTLGVDVETYIKIIDTKCTEEDAKFIIMAVFDENESDIKIAKKIFNKYKEEDEI